MIETKGYFRNGQLVSDEQARLVSGRVPGDPGLIPALHDVIKRSRGDEGSFVWIAVFEPSRAELAVVGELLGLPELQIDDAANPNQRAKIEADSQHLFLVFKLLEYVEATSDIETGQMSIFVGHGYLVTVRHGSSGSMDWVLEQLRGNEEAAKHGPIALLHAVLDNAVDEYLTVADEVSTDIEQIEESVFSPHRSDSSTAIYKLKRENLEIRRAVQPLVPVAQRLIRDEAHRVPQALRPYFRDIADHILRTSDTLDTNDSPLMTMLMASMSRQDLQQNQDMRRISAWVAVAAVPTMIAGVYGMNFDYMPELHEVWGYPVVLLLMASICTFMYRRFKKSGWL